MGGLDRMVERIGRGESGTGSPDGDDLLRSEGVALLIGVLLDQQMRAELAFLGPYRLLQRLGQLDVAEIARMDETTFAAICREKPSIHRFSGMMAKRIQILAQALMDRYNGHAEQIWEHATEEKIRERAMALPGFGKEKVETLINALILFGHIDVAQ